jgi:signal recognition particle receptor subunit beta
MANILDGIITVIVGVIETAAKIPGAVAEGYSSLRDFIYVRYYGLAFIVLGSRQTGKTTLIKWLSAGPKGLEGFEPSPTAGGGDVVPRFNTHMDEETIRVKLERDVGGEYAMWETDWIDLFREAQPTGIIFMLDHQDVRVHKEALNFVLQMIDEEGGAKRNLKALLILVNKSDLWGPDTSLDTVLKSYSNEMRRVRLLASRLGLWYEVHSCSLVTGRGITEAMRGFLNAIRPKPRKVIPISYE